MEAEDEDGDTALHLVLLQVKNTREQGSSGLSSLLNVLFRVQPKNIDKAPAIKKARHSINQSINHLLAIMT